MRLQAPFATVTPTVDGEVLGVLAATDRWFTVDELHEQIDHRSPEGIRLVIRRLAKQGVIEVQRAGRGSVYRLNREHLAADAIVSLASLRDRLVERLAVALGGWAQRPIYAALTGAVEAGEMDDDSPVEILLVRPPDASDAWERDVAELILAIYRWTSNDAVVTEVDPGVPIRTGLAVIGDAGAHVPASS